MQFSTFFADGFKTNNDSHFDLAAKKGLLDAKYSGDLATHGTFKRADTARYF